MKTKVLTSLNFRRRAKKLLKKYNSLKNDLKDLIVKLNNNPTLGVSLGNNCYKIRLAVQSKGKGKSGGVRIISHLLYNVNLNNDSKIVVLLTIYDKSEFESILDKDIIKLLTE
ncbi:MAG: hypothetical protein NTW25_03600, partial [Candidatus Kapabacteria bacterium]|nr:hypothetical protein [Candidatus Kapabacteria bacterium]